MYSLKSKKYKNKKGLKLALAISVVLIIGGLVFAYLEKSGHINLISDKPDSLNSDSINYSPPTEKEKSVGDEIKDKISNNDNGSTNQDPNKQTVSKKSVTPVISAWHQDEDGNVLINGFVQGVIERDGTCEYTLAKDGKKVVESRNGMINAQDTTCGQIVIDKNKLSVGQWQATLRYTSPTSEGASNETTIEVR